MERVMNKYVPKNKKSVSYPNRITSLWKFFGAYQCVLLERYMQWNAIALIYT